MAKKKPNKKPAKRKAQKNRGATDALAIIDKRYYDGNPKRQAALRQAIADEEVGRKIYALRTKAGLTQQELAKLVGTSRSVICRLEDADYEGHSLPMLRRIATALNKRLEIRFVSLRTNATA